MYFEEWEKIRSQYYTLLVSIDSGTYLEINTRIELNV